MTTMSDEDIDAIAERVVDLQTQTVFEDNPPADLIYEPEINGYRSPGTGRYFLKAGGGRMREITKSEHDAAKGF